MHIAQINPKIYQTQHSVKWRVGEFSHQASVTSPNDRKCSWFSKKWKKGLKYLDNYTSSGIFTKLGAQKINQSIICPVSDLHLLPLHFFSAAAFVLLQLRSDMGKNTGDEHKCDGGGKYTTATRVRWWYLPAVGALVANASPSAVTLRKIWEKMEQSFIHSLKK